MVPTRFRGLARLLLLVVSSGEQRPAESRQEKHGDLHPLRLPRPGAGREPRPDRGRVCRGARTLPIRRDRCRPGPFRTRADDPRRVRSAVALRSRRRSYDAQLARKPPRPTPNSNRRSMRSRRQARGACRTCPQPLRSMHSVRSRPDHVERDSPAYGRRESYFSRLQTAMRSAAVFLSQHRRSRRPATHRFERALPRRACSRAATLRRDAHSGDAVTMPALSRANSGKARAVRRRYRPEVLVPRGYLPLVVH